ncbi:MAG TPA: hypothetical protein VE397_07595 [Stellaceae bacterium]|jgi:hypothetical protein|nr:hypothetical protein [Stellaceae bacterium]
MPSGRKTVCQAVAALAGATLLLAACADPNPLWTPNSPRNGAQQPVDPIYGTPIPGYPTINGGSLGR